MKETFTKFINDEFTREMYIPELWITDIIEIIIIAVLIYQLIVWIKNTKAWMLLKGILVVAVFILVAAIFHMYTILWIAKNSIPVMAIAAVIVFQPELRRALEKLGERQFLTSVLPIDRKGKENERFSKQTVEEISAAVFEMGKAKTGALIVVEQAIKLTEYEGTGIMLDCLISRQILLNLFVPNTPFHDGAVMIRDDKIVAATCYLPLSDNKEISKELGTRHRAAIGMTEVSDALVIVVSEETGYVSISQGGQIVRNVTPELLEQKMESIRIRNNNENSKIRKFWGGWKKDEKSAD